MIYGYDMKKILILCFVCFATIAVFLLYRIMEHQRIEPFREGLSDYKAGNYGEAIRKITPLAEDGFEPAQHLLGQMYAYGWGGETNNDIAQKWLSLSCASDESCVEGEREFYLAKDFYDGPPASVIDHEKAIYWMRISANKDYAPAKEWLRKHKENGNTHGIKTP